MKPKQEQLSKTKTDKESLSKSKNDKESAKKDKKMKNIVDIESYKPRDWDYQSPKHQIRPPFVLGRCKRRIKAPSQKEFPVFKDYYTNPATSTDFYKRELRPAIYRSYKLSQIYTLPGAVKVEESKINDDQNKKDRIKVIRSKNLCFQNKLLCDYGSDVAFLPGSKNEAIKKGKIGKLKSCGDFRIKQEKKIKEEKKVFSPQRNRIKRNIKIKK